MSGATEAAAQTGALVFELGGLWQRLSTLVDRRGRRGKRYPLAVVLMLMVLAKLSGQDRPSAKPTGCVTGEDSCRRRLG